MYTLPGFCFKLLVIGSFLNYRLKYSVVIPPPNEVGGGVYWIHLVRLSVCLSVDDMVSGA